MTRSRVPLGPLQALCLWYSENVPASCEAAQIHYLKYQIHHPQCIFTFSLFSQIKILVTEEVEEEWPVDVNALVSLG